MNNSYIRRGVAMLLVLVFAFSCCIAYSEEDNKEISTKSDPLFQSYGVTLSERSGNVVHITFSVAAKQTVDKLGVSSYRVYRMVDGAWKLAATYSGSHKSDTISYTFSTNYQGVNGGKYRVKATFHCKNDGADRYTTMTSSSITL